MEQQPNKPPFSIELQEAIQQLSSLTTEELLNIAKSISSKENPFYGRDEVITAIAIILDSRNQIPEFNAPAKPNPFEN